jgi:hypothetical protein
MISTVTTTTVTTVTSISMMATMAFLAILILLVLTVQKEIISVSENPRLQSWGRIINIAIVPLLLSFAFIAVVTVAGVLR